MFLNFSNFAKEMLILTDDLIKCITARLPSLSKRQKKIAEYIIAHYDKAAFMTAARLGQSVEVSESTVVRFAMEMGFEGYPQLQKSLQEMIRNRLTSVQRMEMTDAQLGSGDILEKILMMDIDKIRRTIEETSRSEFEKSINVLIKAKTIYIMGVRSTFSLANFTFFYFNQMFDDVRLVTTSATNNVFDQILSIGEDDVFLGLSFPRYSKPTVTAIEYAKEKGAKTIAITDSAASPISEFADIRLYARSDMTSFVDSLVAPLSLINALIVSCGMRNQDKLTEKYKQLEPIWSKYEVYAK